MPVIIRWPASVLMFTGALPCWEVSQHGFSSGTRDPDGEAGVSEAASSHRDEFDAGQYQTAVNLTARIDLYDRFGSHPGGWFRWAFTQFEMTDANWIVEVGCGTGELWARNSDRLPLGRLVLTDLSFGMLAEAARRLCGLQRNVHWFAADCQALPFPDQFAEVIIANHMLYHVPDIPRALAELQRILRPTGRLYVATHGQRHLRELDDLARNVGLRGAKVSDVERFDFESGHRYIGNQFTDVQILHYPDLLKATDSEPLLRFIESTNSGERLTRSIKDTIRAFLNSHISTNGYFALTSEVGLICARK